MKKSIILLIILALNFSVSAHEGHGKNKHDDKGNKKEDKKDKKNKGKRSDRELIRAILDSNGLSDVKVEDVADIDNEEETITELDFSGLEITMLPEEIIELEELETLIIDDNSLTEISEEIMEWAKELGIELPETNTNHEAASVKDMKTGESSSSFKLSNSPNPFNPETEISFNITTAGFAQINIYNSEGRLVASPVSKSFSVGNHSISWNASSLSSGVYLIQILSSTGSFVRTAQLVR